MKTLLIDDTRLARNELSYLLSSHDDIKIVGEAENARQGLDLIRRSTPDLVFLDIQMPGMNGFEMLEQLDEAPEVVFVTAYDAYAIKAFEYNALDYLQKPVTPARLQEALQKVRERIKARQSKKVMHEESQVFVKDGEKCWFVYLRDIRLFEVEDNYTRIYFQEQRPMIPKTLNYLESRLDPEVFFRANRQQMINLKWVDRVEPWFSGTLRVFLKDGTKVDVSRRQTIRLKELMSF
ncbi:MAG: LytR/AlgR family response regulator transcription factor [Cyclobacteriaceae bacterium]